MYLAQNMKTYVEKSLFVHHVVVGWLGAYKRRKIGSAEKKTNDVIAASNLLLSLEMVLPRKMDWVL